MAGAGPGLALGGLLDYKTAKFALTRNRRVGLLHRLLQLGVLGYLLGWVLLVRKGYQDTDRAPRAAVVTKLKGAAAVAGTSRRLWDAADYARPPQGEDVIFLVTNFIATAQQAQGTCPESAAVLDAVCTEDADCPMGNPVARGNGIKTGKCVMFNTTHSTCEIYGWCPVENSTLPRKPLLAEAENFTLFIKNTVHFTKFNFSKCNTLQTNDPTYFKTCLYDSFFSPSCPVFRVRDMVEAAGETFGDLALLGGSIGVRIEWDCDLDQPAARCQPQYSFSLQDRSYNFRTASYYWDSQRQLHRNLLKLYGIRFDISVHGQPHGFLLASLLLTLAGKFSIVPAAVSIGTGIAFFGAATVLCDLVLLYLDAKAEFYWKEKFEEAKPPKCKTEAAA
ncbi:P2X purinoceptor 6 isoform B [Patagioenas fasciata monilis]|uniref:P2X purinoceptor n=1 Tax=Patagioenas fasciata monilis TaxID=372326 RepID=A0A1V4J2C8_PATFA|nr:P2X purinoceptor 6 isoform B [Patagioenas fasciata monilis]